MAKRASKTVAESPPTPSPYHPIAKWFQRRQHVYISWYLHQMYQHVWYKLYARKRHQKSCEWIKGFQNEFPTTSWAEVVLNQVQIPCILFSYSRLYQYHRHRCGEKQREKKNEKENKNEKADYYIYMLIFIRNV